MSYAEFTAWAEYRRVRGTLTPTRHLEHGFAMLAKLYIDRNRRKGAQPIALWQLMPHEDEPPITLDEAMRSWN